MIVIKTIQAGNGTTCGVIAALKHIVSGTPANSLLRRMQDDGLIKRIRGGWRVTPAGETLAPPPSLPPMVVYKPPAPNCPREHAMDYRELPSVAAGRLRDYQKHV